METKIGADFQNASNFFKIQTALHSFIKKASVSKYNDQFKISMLEVRFVIFGQVFYWLICGGLRPAVQI